MEPHDLGGEPAILDEASRAMGIRLPAQERRLLEQLVELREQRVYEASGTRIKLTMTSIIRSLVLKEAEKEGLIEPMERGRRPAPSSAAAAPPPAPAKETQSPNPESVKKLVLTALAQGDFSQASLAEASGVTRQRIGYFLKGTRHLEAEELARVFATVSDVGD